jgi:hypothetical protein
VASVLTCRGVGIAEDIDLVVAKVDDPVHGGPART